MMVDLTSCVPPVGEGDDDLSRSFGLDRSFIYFETWMLEEVPKARFRKHRRVEAIAAVPFDACFGPERRPWQHISGARGPCHRIWAPSRPRGIGFDLVKLSSSLVVVAALFGVPSFAHEVRPGYLELREVATERWDVLWKQPAQGEMILRLDPVFPDGCVIAGAGQGDLLPGALLERAIVRCDAALVGRSVWISGLDTTLTDVLVRVHRLDGSVQTSMATPTHPGVEIGGDTPAARRVGAYLRLGFQHILLGADHLLFVLGLVLLVGDRWMLVKTVSAFTVAHSITLALATLGLASVPTLPLNVAIALSILFLAPEVIRSRRGGSSLTIRRPWVVAFAFGLLHGFGFASGLVAMGLPTSELPWALLLFNVGVELGQLAFVLVLLMLIGSFAELRMRWPRWALALPVYAIGTLGAFWTIVRTTLMFGAMR